jgi:hypothetical protein
MAAGVPGGARRQHLRRRPGPPAQLPSLASSFTSHLSPLPLGDPIGQARSHGLPSPRASSTGGWRPAARRPPPHGYTLAFEANLGLDASCVKWSGGGGGSAPWRRLRLTRMTLAAAVVGVVVAVDGDLCGSALWWLRPRAAVLA